MFKENMNRKILIIDNSIAATGAFKSINSYAKGLSGKFQFSFGINKNSEIKAQLVKDNFEILNLSFLEIQKNFKVLFYFPVLVYNSVKISYYLKRNGIKTLHVNDIYNMTGILIKIFYPDIFLIYHIRLLKHSYASVFYNLWGKFVNRFSDRIICVSKIVANSYPFNPNKTIIIHDAMAIDKKKVISKTVEDNNLIQLCYIGNYIEGKGQDLALSAFTEAVKTNTNLRLSFIGGTLSKTKNIRYKSRLIKKSKDLGISDLIRFNGPSANIEEDYLKADIILNFSENESFSMVCLEAMAYGKPLIASNSGGPEEIIDNYENGLIIPNRDIGRMAEAIIELSGDQEMMKKFSINGPIKVSEKFDIDLNKIKLQKVYNEA